MQVSTHCSHSRAHVHDKRLRTPHSQAQQPTSGQPLHHWGKQRVQQGRDGGTGSWWLEGVGVNAHARKRRQHCPRMDPLVPCFPNGATPTALCLDTSGAPPRRVGGRAPFHPEPGSWTSHGTRREVERDGSCDNRRPCRDARGPGDKAHSPDTGPQGARQTGAAEKQMGSWHITLGRRGIQGDGEFWGRVWWLMEIDPLCYFLNG